MTVFRGYIRIIKRNFGTILMYVAIFMTVMLLAQNAYLGSGMVDGFRTLKMNVAVIDRDGGALAGALREMLERKQNVVDLKDDPQVMQEELYYENVKYILAVPEGAEDKLRRGETAVESITAPGTYAAYYAEAEINNLLNQIRVCLSAGVEMEEACERALKLGESDVQVTLLDVNGNAGMRETYNYFFGYMPYAFLASAISVMGVIIMEFKKREVKKRIQSSAVPFRNQTMAAVIAFLLVGLMIWGIFVAIQAVLYRGGIFTGPHTRLYIANSLLCILVALSLGFFSGTLSASPTALTGMNNIISLGLCFLGGIFVPLEMLGPGLLKFSQFLPTYWYSVINGLLGDHAVLSEEMTDTIGKGMLIQALFAAAVFGVTMMIRRRQMREG